MKVGFKIFKSGGIACATVSALDWRRGTMPSTEVRTYGSLVLPVNFHVRNKPAESHPEVHNFSHDWL